jgi:aldehyde:ferredoxin oxidoreductase
MSADTADSTDGVPEMKHLLRVNLSEETVETETVPKEWRDRFLSGKGLAAAYMLEELDPGVDPLSPENELFFMFGPMSAVAPGTSRYAAVTKSPLTGAFVDSYSGGHFPARCRFALPSYLGIVFEGEADRPVYLEIDDGDVSIEDASDLWGLRTDETAREFPDKNTKVAAIGPAGENGVRFATISSDEGTHHAGRGGVGAVMGSKNLKAVVARADEPIGSPDQDLTVEHTKRLGSGDGVAWAREGGTQNIVDWTSEVGAIPNRHWTRGTPMDQDAINIDAFEPGHVDTDSCYACPVACGHVVQFEGSGVEGAYPDAQVGWGPEYETIGMMGSNTSIEDVTGITELANHADTLGMDTISLGNVVSFTMELAEKGLIDHDIEFGDAESAVELVENIAHREGVGEDLALGVAEAAEKLTDGDPDAREAAIEVKGMEPPAYDPRASYSMGLAYATSDRGACHQRAFPIGSDALGSARDPRDTEGHAEAVVEEQNEGALLFSMVTCDFTGYDYERSAEWLNALGYDLDVDDLETVGERAYNMTRLFNVREGFDRDDDSLPERMTKPLQAGGPADGSRLTQEDFETMLEEYYDLRDWTQDGRPSESKLEELDIAEFAAD